METVQKLSAVLLPKLSIGATITTEVLSRWSTYKAPAPAAVVDVKSEADVATTVSLPYHPLRSGHLMYTLGQILQ
jgi:hypothetical protein